VGQFVPFLAQSWTAVAVLVVCWFHAAAFPPCLFIAVNNYLSCPFVSRELGEIWIWLSCWKLWCSCILVVCCGSCGRGERRNLLGDVSRHFGLDVYCSPSARLLMCTGDCSSLFHCLQTNLAQLAYEILLKISLRQANEQLESCVTFAFLAGIVRLKSLQKDWI